MDHKRPDIHNPHDSLFAATSGSTANIGAMQGELRSRWTYGMFRALVEGEFRRPAFLVVEHKLRVDGSLTLQLMRYLTVILETCGQAFRFLESCLSCCIRATVSGAGWIRHRRSGGLFRGGRRHASRAFRKGECPGGGTGRRSRSAGEGEPLHMGQCLAYISCAVEIIEGERGLRELVRG